MKLWEMIRNGEDYRVGEVDTLNHHTQTMFAGAFSPNGEVVATGGVGGHVVLWNRQAVWQNRGIFLIDQWISNVCFLGGKDQIVIAHHAAIPNDPRGVPEKYAVSVWDLRNKNELQVLLPNSAVSLVTSSIGVIAAGTKDGNVHLWDSHNGFLLSKPAELEGYPFPLAFSPDGISLAAGSTTGKIRLWNVKERKIEKTISTSVTGLTAVAWNTRGNELAVGTRGGEIVVLNRASEETEALSQRDGYLISSLSFSPDNRLLASSAWNSSTCLWRLERPERQCSVLDGHNLSVVQVKFSPDGKTLFSASGDRTIKIWDVPTGQLRFTLRGHDAPIQTMDLSADGRTLVTGGRDGQVRVWNSE